MYPNIQREKNWPYSRIKVFFQLGLFSKHTKISDIWQWAQSGISFWELRQYTYFEGQFIGHITNVYLNS